MGTLQGNGKVRLIAKKGRFRTTEYTNRQADLIRNSTFQGTPAERAAQRAALVTAAEAELALGADGGLSNYYVEFDATPDITESGSASYFEAGEIRAPGSILMWMGSPSRTFSVSAKLISRNQIEAKRSERMIHLLKSWRQPERYTGGINASPPTVLYLQGYGKMFKDIPVVLTDLTIEFSSEHDYISIGEQTIDYWEGAYRELNVAGGPPLEIANAQPRSKKFTSAVPIITSVSLTLKEARAADAQLDGLEGFDILKYRNGELIGW